MKSKNEQLSSQEDLKNLDMEDVIATVKKQTKSYQRYSNEQKASICVL